MSLRSKLQLHLSDKHVSWSGDVARWTEDGHASLLSIAPPGPLAASFLVDAVVLAIAESARATVAYEGGDPGEIARRTAARLGVTLLDATHLPEPETPALAPAHAPALAEAPVPTPVPMPEPEPLTVPALPWSGPAPEPVVAEIHVSPIELLALPWHAELGDPHEVTVTQRRPAGSLRPTQMPDWGLPWPRPVAPMDAVAIADPRLWGSPERVRAMREDLDARGGGSFGQFKAEGSAWLKRIQDAP